MKQLKVVLGIFLLMGVVACEGTIEVGETSGFQDVTTETPGDPGGKADSLGDPTQSSGGQDGVALYQQHCGACHGADATGGASYPTSIVGFTPIDDIVKNGTGVMPAIAIDDSQIAAIQSFLLGDSDATPDQQPAVTIDENSTGLEVFAAECAACHGDEGQGTPNGPVIRLRAPDFAEFAIREGRNGRGNPSRMPAYDHSQVTDAQLEEMVAWLDAFPNPTTGEGLYNRYCASCHGDDGLGGPSFKALAGIPSLGTIIRDGHANGRYEERTEYMPGWTEDQISEAEVAMIANYLRQM